MLKSEKLENVHSLVLDTNVFISALLTKGYPYKILFNLVASSKIELLISEVVVEEYEEVINYTKFSRFPDFVSNANLILTQIKTTAIWVEPDIKLSVVKDAADNKFLELAVAGKAAFLVTGNTRHFNFKKYKNVEIISPADYYKNYWL